MSSNNFTRQPRRFSFNARGNKGIDFLFSPFKVSCIRYSHYVVGAALLKLTELGIASPTNNNAPLNADELELLLKRLMFMIFNLVI